MITLNTLYQDAATIAVNAVTNDSREVKPGTLFVAIQGRYFDGHDYLQEVMDKGAVGAIVSKRCESVSLPQFVTDDVMREMARCSNIVYGTNTYNATFVGVTGTDGKTTTATLVSQFMQKWHQTGYIGTSGIMFGDTFIEPTLTTPLPPVLHQSFKMMRDTGVDYIAMEASSHAQDMGRDAHIPYTRAIFTNLTPDHLDYHETMDNYFHAKETIFRNLPNDGYAIINGDDAYGRKIQTDAQIIYYGMSENNDVYASDIQYHPQGTTFTLHLKDEVCEIKTQLVADFNVYNILALASLAHCEGISLFDIKTEVEQLMPVEGRMQVINQGQDFGLIVDMAHAPNSVEKVLTFAREMTDGQIIAITGCDGDRDRTKRPVIARICAELATHTIFTEGDTYSEYVEDIVKEMVDGIDTEKTNYEIEYDRGMAIQKAIQMAKSGDVIFVLGRGSEEYIPRRGEKIPFNDITKSIEYVQLQLEKKIK